MSRDREPLLPGLEQIGRDLERAAAGPAPARTAARRRMRRTLVIAVGLLLLAAIGATAAGIISVGEPAKPKTDSPSRFGPAGERAVVLRAQDPGAELPLGVAVYESRGGRDCVLAGRVRGATLGALDDGTFRPYRPDAVGSCGDLERRPFFAATEAIDGGRRTVLYGRAAPAVRRLRITVAGDARTVTPHTAGAFLLVLDGTPRPDEIRIQAG